MQVWSEYTKYNRNKLESVYVLKLTQPLSVLGIRARGPAGSAGTLTQNQSPVMNVSENELPMVLYLSDKMAL